MRGAKNFLELRARTFATYEELSDLIVAVVKNADLGRVNNVHEILHHIKQVADSFLKSSSKIFRSFERILDGRGCPEEQFKIYLDARDYFEEIGTIRELYLIKGNGHKTVIRRLCYSGLE